MVVFNTTFSYHKQGISRSYHLSCIIQIILRQLLLVKKQKSDYSDYMSCCVINLSASQITIAQLPLLYVSELTQVDPSRRRVHTKQ